MKTTESILKKVCKTIDDKKGEETLVLDVSKVSSFTDYFVICHGYNERQNQAICDGIVEQLKKEDNLRPSHVEGYRQAEWILIDYMDFVVHIFSLRSRQFYKLEKLWSDGVELHPEALGA